MIEKFRSVFMRTNHLEPLKIKLYQRFLPPPYKNCDKSKFVLVLLYLKPLKYPINKPYLRTVKNF